MPKMFFVTLPVSDVKRSTAFYKSLGFSFNPQMTGEGHTCLIVSETSFVMLGTRDRLAELTTREIADPRKATSALMSLWFDSRAEVDAHIEAALKAGGTEAHEAEDMGFMYQRAYYDLDGHGWGISWMDPNAAMPAPDAT